MASRNIPVHLSEHIVSDRPETIKQAAGPAEERSADGPGLPE